MKKILITGASGMLGSNICFAFNNDFNVTGVYFSHVPRIHDIKIVNIDLRNKIICQNIIGLLDPNIVIHCAAITDLDMCETNHKLAYDVNMVGTKNIINSISDDCHFIYISTDNVYNSGKAFNQETMKKTPTNVYGLSKLKAEQMVEKYIKNYTILRTNIFGWHLLKINSGLLSFIYHSLISNNKTNLFKDVFFTPISIPFFINGLIQIIDKKLIGTFNFAGKERISKFDFGLKVADVFGLEKSLINPISIDEKCFIAKRPKEMSMNSSKISKYVPVPQTVIEQIVKLGVPY
jgi:dTDP-4-dehydrorhamnose reductase